MNLSASLIGLMFGKGMLGRRMGQCLSVKVPPIALAILEVSCLILEHCLKVVLPEHLAR